MDALVAGLVSVLGLNAYAAVLVVLRSRIWRVRLYRPMLTNIGLSFLPLVIAALLVVGSVALVLGTVRIGITAAAPTVAVTFLIFAGAIWLLLFPNAAYLITELNLNHREPDSPVPLWFDIVQTLTLTLSGVANALSGLAVVQLLAVTAIDANALEAAPAASWAVALMILALGTVGIYLGRYLRLNSVDARRPLRLLSAVRRYFSSTARVKDALGFIVTHTGLLALLYVPFFTALFRLVVG